MTQEEKDLLIKDLCTRLPYGVKINVNGEEDTLIELGVDTGWVNASYDIDDVKPYLRPMSSMTDEEQKEYDNFLFDNLEGESIIGYEDKRYGIDVIMRWRSGEVVDWLNEHHFDYRGLIEEYCLAIEAPEGMYDIKKK